MTRLNIKIIFCLKRKFFHDALFLIPTRMTISSINQKRGHFGEWPGRCFACNYNKWGTGVFKIQNVWQFIWLVKKMCIIFQTWKDHERRNGYLQNNNSFQWDLFNESADLVKKDINDSFTIRVIRFEFSSLPGYSHNSSLDKIISKNLFNCYLFLTEKLFYDFRRLGISQES